jgi:dihydrofolate reductase
MPKVTLDMSITLDGFITGPYAGVEHPLGAGGERLHEWIYGLSSWRERHGLSGGEADRDVEILDEAFTTVGATVMGRGMFDVGEGPWGDEPPFHLPVFVLTNRRREPLVKDGGRRSPS